MDTGRSGACGSQNGAPRGHKGAQAGLRLAPALLPSHSTILLHTLHKNIRGFRHGVLLTERLSVCFHQTDGMHYTLHQLKPTAPRSCFHSAQLPRQPAEAGQEKETAANTSCDRADVHGLVGGGRQRGERYGAHKREVSVEVRI